MKTLGHLFPPRRRAPLAPLSPLLLVLAALLALPADVVAAEAGTADETSRLRLAELAQEPTFWIEGFVVLGNQRVSEEILLAETLLVPGGTYGEPELREAIYRLRRLPFVVDASFALRRGFERGRYVLEIRVDETPRFFFGDNVVYSRYRNDASLAGLFGDSESIQVGPTAGARFFVGDYGVLFASTRLGQGIQLGYSQHNLWDRRAFFSVGLGIGRCCPSSIYSLGLDPTFSSWENNGGEDFHQAQLTFGLPLEPNRALRLQLEASNSPAGSRTSLVGDFESTRRLRYRDARHLRVELAYLHDTTDDPVFPSQGSAWTLALDHQRLSADVEVPEGGILTPPVTPPASGPLLPQTESSHTRLSAAYEHHWRLGRRQSVSLGVRAAIGQASVRNLPVIDQDCAAGGSGRCAAVLRLVESEGLDLVEVSLDARWSIALGNPTWWRDRGELRFEQLLELGFDRTSPSLDLPNDPLQRWSTTSSLVLRTRWGVFRFSVQVAEYSQGAWW